MIEHLTIIKVGGKVVEEEESLQNLLRDFSRIAGNKILVHGGGTKATAIGEKLGVKPKMVEGRRVTDEGTLEVVTMVYAGLVNKNLVAKLQALGTNALGLTGADLDVVRAKKRPVAEVDYGFVGDVVNVNNRMLRELLENGAVPVVAPITHDGDGQLFNTNADTIASELAIALSSSYRVTLIYCFDKRGVLMDESDEDSVIDEITMAEFEEMKSTGTVNGGMIPKLTTGFNAMKQGVNAVVVTNASALSGSKGGTRLALFHEEEEE
ncbi:acetylglutamate kinase [Prolixibacter sp. NT017]|uniref:acetylglutamate kinase n=1 Tax=Prolixibacter sp. NT017 TaxID=2652390 RepID=UPI001281557C|nr:acetylglutamate kinase [Prolixibacter sp. NT017]GET26569.1 acetylglutamate kinase [Prolixibacter sp. NT017]